MVVRRHAREGPSNIERHRVSFGCTLGLSVKPDKLTRAQEPSASHSSPLSDFGPTSLTRKRRNHLAEWYRSGPEADSLRAGRGFQWSNSFPSKRSVRVRSFRADSACIPRRSPTAEKESRSP